MLSLALIHTRIQISLQHVFNPFVSELF